MLPSVVVASRFPILPFSIQSTDTLLSAHTTPVTLYDSVSVRHIAEYRINNLNSPDLLFKVSRILATLSSEF